MKKNILLFVVAVLTVFAIGCSSTAEAHGLISASMFELEYIRNSWNVYEYRDAETGVHYLIFDDTAGCRGRGGICPRYDADGTLYVD